MRKKRALLNLMSLENKIVPAVTVTSSKGNLNITGDNQMNSVFISGQGSALTVHVVQGQNVLPAFTAAGGNPAPWETPANSRGTFNVTGSINVTMGSNNDLVVFTWDDGSTTNNAITVGMGPGSDNVQMQTRTNGNANLGGAVLLGGGSGADDLVCFDINFGKTLTMNGDQPGLRTDTALPGDAVVISDVNVTGAMTVNQCITLIDSTYGVNTLGSLSVTLTTINERGDFQLIDGTQFPATGGGPGKGRYNGLLVLDTGSTVLGTLNYQGSYDTDGVYIYGTVNGLATITSGANNKHAAAEDDFFIGDYAGPGGHVAESGFLLGGVSYRGSTGPDHLRIAAGSVINGGATFDMDGGNNIYELDQAWTETGKLTFIAGKGNDHLGTLGGTVNGDESFSLGDGNNSVRLAGTFNGTTTTYVGGAGVDAVRLAGAYKAFKGTFGGGNDSFTYEAGSSLTNFNGDGGTNTDTYDSSAVVQVWPETIVNFEVII